MLTSLGIRNYRNLKSLDIERLARVNLIAGKNNTGKTSLLEAVSLYAAGGSILWINTLLKSRGDYHQIAELPDKVLNLTEMFNGNLKSYGSLFNQRAINNEIEVGSLPLDKSKKLSISVKNEADRGLIFTTQHKNNSFLFSLYQDPIQTAVKTKHLVRSAFGTAAEEASSISSFQFVGTKGNLREENHQLWSNIALTDKENQVVEALKIIDSNVARMSFIEAEISRERKAVVRMENSQDILPLQSMGDGMNRILTIILALVNASDGYLLIDEFENGLHYTVQEDLWEMIFTLAKELNVQVFATTHSDDCIRAFEHVLNSEDNQERGLYFRLDNINGQIMPTFYSPSELNTATEQIIEMR